MVHAAKEDNILKWLVKYDSNLLLMHHRFPTSTINVKRAAHPFSTKKHFGKAQYILVHNGSIRNAEELFAEHSTAGIRYHSILQDLTFNDSEALLWDFALFMEGKQPELKARGGIAFICLKLEKGKLTKMYFARNSNPLNMLRTKQGISLSSEGVGESIEPDMLYTWNYGLRRLTSKKLTIPSNVYQSAKTYSSNYDNYTPSTSPRYSGFGRGAYTPNSYADSRYDNAGDSMCDDCNDWGYACGEHFWPNQIEQEENDRRMGLRLGNALARQFGHLFKDDDPVIPRSKNIIEYEQDPDTQLMLPVGSKVVKIKTLEEHLNHAEQRRAAKSSFVDRVTPISEAEVTREYMQYLDSVKGHFEQAYWSLECDYEQAENLPTSKSNLRARRLLEKLMERIDTDPEYVNEESVSEAWLAWRK